MDERDSHCPYLLSSETTAKGTGLAESAGKEDPNNKVDLTNPELTIIVEVIKTVCCLSVVKDYSLYRKYNVQEVIKEEAPKPDAAAEKTATDQPEQKEEKPTNQEEKKGEEENGKKVSQESEEGKKSEEVKKNEEVKKSEEVKKDPEDE